MRRFSNLRAIALSFFSKELYRDVARNWLGAGIVYLPLISFLSVVPALVAMQLGIAAFAREEAGPILAQIPTTLVHNGRVSAAVRMPYVIRGSSGRPVAILDTTGQVTTLDTTGAQILVTSTQLIMRKSASETRTFELARVQHFELDRSKAARWLRLVVNWFALALSPFVFGGLFVPFGPAAGEARVRAGHAAGRGRLHADVRHRHPAWHRRRAPAVVVAPQPGHRAGLPGLRDSGQPRARARI